MFPSDIKGCMKDCILSILWPRQDILKFFVDNGCTSSEVSHIRNFKETQLSRSAMIDIVFSRLAVRPDGGLGQFRAVLKSLLEWSYFDSYYFDKLHKLDRSKAERNINHLRQLQEIRDAKIQKEREHRASSAAKLQKTEATLPQLLSEFLNLHSGRISPQKRGYALQDILLNLARLAHLEITEPFTVVGEQIDGALKYEGEHYLLEAKWQDKAASNEPVYQFAGKIDGKMYGRGMFVSINGYSQNVVHSLVIGKAINTILVDGEDLVLVLEGQISFRKMIDAKVKAAQTRGGIYIHPITSRPKFS